MTAEQLLRMWLEEARNEMSRRAARADGAYTKEPIRTAAQRLALAYYDASSVFERALAELPAEASSSEKKDPQP